MPFEQFRLDRSVNQTRGIFDKYIYSSTTDTIADIKVSGYFAASRFRANDPDGWINGVIEAFGSDGFVFLQINADGVSVTELALGGLGAIPFATRSTDSLPAIFTTTGNRDTYYTTNPGDLTGELGAGREAVGIGPNDGNPVGITAAFIRNDDNTGWIAVASNFVGPAGAAGAPGADGSDGAAGPPGHTTAFASETARDTYFNASQSNRDDLTNGYVITVNIGSNTAQDQTWQGTVDSPVTYNAALWEPASVGVANASLSFQDELIISDYGEFIKAEDTINSLTYLALGQRYTEAGGSQNARQLSFSGETTLASTTEAADSALATVHTYTFDTTGMATDPFILLSATINFLVAPNFYINEIFRGADDTAPRVFRGRFSPPGTGVYTARPGNATASNVSPQQFQPNTQYFVKLTGDVAFQYRTVSGDTAPAGTATGFTFTFQELATQDFVRSMISRPANAEITAFGITGLTDFSPGVGVELGGARTITYTVTNSSLVSGNLTFNWDAVDIKTDIDPAGSSDTVNIPSTITVAGATHTAILSGTDTTGNAFSRTLTYTTPNPQEQLYIGTIATNDATTFDTGTATSIDFAPSPQTITIPTFAGNSHIAYAQRASEPELTAITIGGINQLAGFTTTDNAIQVHGVFHDVWVSNNLLVGSIVSGQQMILER